MEQNRQFICNHLSGWVTNHLFRASKFSSVSSVFQAQWRGNRSKHTQSPRYVIQNGDGVAPHSLARNASAFMSRSKESSSPLARQRPLSVPSHSDHGDNTFWFMSISRSRREKRGVPSEVSNERMARPMASMLYCTGPHFTR